MEAFLHQFLSGLANGGIYASIALALVMIYQATHHINFAQGEQGMFSAYVALMLVQAGFPYWAAFVLALAFGFVTGVAIERIIIRPVRTGAGAGGGRRLSRSAVHHQQPRRLALHLQCAGLPIAVPIRVSATAICRRTRSA